ncbi:MAG: hypothetical protein ACR2MG_14315, partial [Pyrinomonadaceae bacterium]
MQNIWTKLLETAIHAPSPHNVQPWRVKIINETEAELYIDSRRTLPKEDITGSFIILTMGLFIEALSISEYKMDAVVGGEGMSESLRSFMLKSFKTVVSSYGASDLEINIGVETELTIALRHLCFENRELCETIFGSETPPMIFQYNAADYLIETSPDGELLFSIVRFTGAAPKIRYNLRDLGGTFSSKK